MALTDIDGQRLGDSVADKLGDRNLIINGAMTVSQRYTSNSGQTASAFRACDRFRVDIDNLGTWTISQSTSAPADFVNSLRIECTTADASPAANDYVAVLYHVEAQDVSWINYGTADAKPLTLSFYVRSNKTGSASFEVRQRDNANKLYSKVYSFSGTADVWKKVEIPIPADTAGLINNDNGAGLTLMWWLNGGSTFTGGGPTNGWEAFDDTKRNSTNAGIGGAVNDYFEITGVQLEVGNTATPFQHRSYSDELRRCQRYCVTVRTDDAQTGVCNGNMWTSSVLIGVYHFPTPMRDKPALTTGVAGGDATVYSAGSNAAATSVVEQNQSLFSTELVAQTGGGLTQGNASWLRIESGGQSQQSMVFSSELT